MRTSGSERDLVMLLVPIGALIVLTVMLMGGPEEFLRRVDQTVVDSIRWIAMHWS